jgi:flagellar biosynthesis chaperone FliJ
MKHIKKFNENIDDAQNNIELKPVNLSRLKKFSKIYCTPFRDEEYLREKFTEDEFNTCAFLLDKMDSEYPTSFNKIINKYKDLVIMDVKI